MIAHMAHQDGNVLPILKDRRQAGKLESRTPAVLRSDVTSHRVVVIMERRETRMYWTTPTLVEICIGLEINGYLPAEF
jgi:coenzyme PQQ precursor peptide PqqA